MFQQTVRLRDIWSIPNLLSLIRVALIPFVLYYYTEGEVKVAGIILIISAVTDMADGFIARRFSQITALGKILDPLADKLTQISVAVGLCLTYSALIPLALILGIKELLMGLMGFTLLKRGKQPFSARWWGKAATIVFYVAAIAIMLFGHRFSRTLIRIICLTVVILLAYSLFRYYNMLKSQLHER